MFEGAFEPFHRGIPLAGLGGIPPFLPKSFFRISNRINLSVQGAIQPVFISTNFPYIMDKQSSHQQDGREYLSENELSLGMDHPDFGAAGADDRPEATQMKQMQEVADRSPQVRQLKSFQAAADASSQVQQLKTLQRKVNSGGQAVVQRRITHGGQILPNTYKGIARANNPAMASAAKIVWDALVADLGGGVDLKKLEQCWNKVAKSTTQAFNLPSDQQALLDAVKAK